MNKKIVIGIVLILIIGGGVYASQNKKSSSQGTQTVNQTVSEAEEFANAIKSGKPTICTMTKGTDIMEYRVKGQKMRIKTTTTITDEEGASKTTIGHMINDEKFFYTWEETSNQGTKMSLVVPSPSPVASTKSTESTPPFDSQPDYDQLKNEGYTINCRAESIDDSIFTPPPSVKFIDPTEMMKVFPSPGANGNFDKSSLEELQKQYGGE
jgi:uncharacterized protein YxeA